MQEFLMIVIAALAGILSFTLIVKRTGGDCLP